jgi:transposase
MSGWRPGCAPSEPGYLDTTTSAVPWTTLLKRWPAVARFLGDVRICLSNNAAERALRGIAMRVSLCSTFSSVWKHWNGVSVGRATRATLSGGRTFNRFRRQVIGPDLIRRSWDNL